MKAYDSLVKALQSQGIKMRKPAFVPQRSPALLPSMQHQGDRKMHMDSLKVRV